MIYSESEKQLNASPPTHEVFQYLTPLLLGVLGLMSIGKTESIFKTHPANLWAFLSATLIYCPALGLMKTKTIDNSETCSQILTYVLFISGTFSCVSLFSILLPNLIGKLVLWAASPIILAIVALFYFQERIKIAIGLVQDKFKNLWRIANAMGWVEDKLKSTRIANAMGWVKELPRSWAEAA
ncbi:hypothetical protein ACSBR1_034740 [Camellia fascicularis]